MMLNGVQREFRTDDGMIHLMQGDSAALLSHFGPQEFDCCVTDPPYGIDWDNTGGMTESGGWKQHAKLGWDTDRPDRQLMLDAMRVSKQQVIWGGNYFTDYLPPSMQWLVWDKGQRDFSLADCEFAWTSQNRGARIKTISRGIANREERIHPTQKPIDLMVWCIEQIRPVPQSVIDPFAGSFTTAIACIRMGKRFVGIEREPRYFDAGVKRVTEELHRYRAFEDIPKITQRSLLD